MHHLRHIVLGLGLLILSPSMAQLNTDRITSIGRNALYFDDYVLSIQYFNQVIRLKPHLAEPYLLRAIAKIQLQDYTGALHDLNISLERNPFQPGAYYTRGYVYLHMQRLEEAEQDFTEALLFAPENKTYLLLRSEVRSERANYQGALEDIDFLLRREPKSPSLLFEKGVICMSMKDTLCALDEFSQTVLYDSQNAANWSALGLTHLMVGDEDEALVDLTKAINLGSKWAGDYINRGIIFYRKHNYRGAMNDYDHAVQLSPQDAQCYYNRAVLRHELGDWNRALDDMNKAIDLDSSTTEMYYMRGTILLQLNQWKQAYRDFNTLIKAYPYFLPSYYLAAQAKTALGEGKAAFELRKKAVEMEEKKDKLHPDSIPNTSVHLAQNQPQKKDKRKEFSSRTAQNQTETNEDKAYSSTTRGAIQKQYTDVVNCQNIVLSYYAQNTDLKRACYSHPMVDELNRLNALPAQLQFTSRELPLTAEMVNLHFEQISALSSQIDYQPTALLFLARAIEFALVQDYSSAIEDCTQAIIYDSDLLIAYFCRANWRNKQQEYLRQSGEATQENSLELEMIMRDYDYVTSRCPDFSFALYNKANILCSQGEYRSAIEFYTRAITLEPDMAEAYFNRGLTYIYIGENERGLEDLSHAGELGIYQAYNLITRFQ